MGKSGLTFDWDNVGLEDKLVQEELNELVKTFGENKVWYRVSSSGQGLHVIIADIIYDAPFDRVLLSPMLFSSIEQFKHRENSPLECKGRFISDLHRIKNGLKTSRIFIVKYGSTSGEWKRFK